MAPAAPLIPITFCRITVKGVRCDGVVRYQKHRLCAAHYQRWLHGQPIDVAIPRRRTLPPFRPGKNARAQ